MTEPLPDADFAQIKACFEAVCDLPDETARRSRLAELGASAEQVQRVLALLDQDRTLTHGLGGPVAGMLANLDGPELGFGRPPGPLDAARRTGPRRHGPRAAGRAQRRATNSARPSSCCAASAEKRHWPNSRTKGRFWPKLNHPHIAWLLDGGTTPAGRPYLVMEHVRASRWTSTAASSAWTWKRC